MTVRVFYSDHHVVPLPPGHRFPMGKYALLRRALVDHGVVHPDHLVPAGPLVDIADDAGSDDDASDDARREIPPPADGLTRLTAVHDPGYVDRVLTGALDAREVRAIGFPWSRALVRRTLASVHGTLLAARAALGHGNADNDGVAGNLAGGTHHAHADRGSGFCVFNDIAVAARALLDDGAIATALVFDADVHQGDGTAAIFADDPRVFTCSLHGARNFPFHKATSDLDVPLPDDTGDDAYADAIDGALAACFDRLAARGGPDIAFYQAGVDALREDTLGRLALSADGLARRDDLVIGALRARGVPVVLTLGGGYARPLEASVAAHVGTYRVATRYASG